MKQGTVLITGANSGIGKETAVGLAKRGYRIVMACRNLQRAQAAREEIVRRGGHDAVEIIRCDLADLASVAACAEHFRQRHERLDILINNAGGMFYERQLTPDGYEQTFQVNHLGHFYLTRLLLPQLRAGQDRRIINVSSEAHRMARDIPWEDLQHDQTYRPLGVYAEAKLYNILFTRFLARRLAPEGITVNALHPGVVASGFGAGGPWWTKPLLHLARWFAITPEKGAQTSLYLATAPEVAEISGGYFVRQQQRPASELAMDFGAAERLWQKSVQLLAATVD